MEGDVKHSKSELTPGDIELSARHAATTNPRSTVSAAAIAQRVWERGRDTRVRRRRRDPRYVSIVVGGLSATGLALVEVALATPIMPWGEARPVAQSSLPVAEGGQVRAGQSQVAVALR